MSLGDLAQWLALACTIVFTLGSIRATRQESVVNAYLTLNQKLQETLYTLLAEDNNALKKTDLGGFGKLKFHFFQIIDICADMFEMKRLLLQFDRKLWARSDARIQKLFKKPAVQVLWKSQLEKNPELFDTDFIDYVNAIIGTA